MAAPTLQILVDGSEIRSDSHSLDAVVGSVETVQELNRHYWCTIELRQTPDMRPPVEKWIGKDLKVLSTNQDAAGQVMFAGFVLDVKLEYEITGSYRAFLTGVSYSYKLDLAPRREYHAIMEGKKAKSKKLDEIAQIMAGRVGLNADVADAQGVQPPLPTVQWAETDWHFLWRLCDDFGYYLHPTNDGFKITKGFKPGPVSLTWRTEWGLSSFTIGAHLAQPAMAGCHYDYTESASETFKEQEIDSAPFTGAIAPLRAAMRKESKKLPPGYVYWRNRVSTVNEFQDMLKTESRTAVGNKFDCHGVSQVEKVAPGTPVQIDGVIDGEGLYNVHSVAHHWDQIGYSNSFWCTPWKDYHSTERPQRPFVSGVYSARVVDIDDPERRGEVRVQYFWQEENETGWIRHLSSYAGEDRGIFFRPELGDEVMVAFEEGDPERPVIVGSSWNKTDGTPNEDFWGEETKDNDVKRIVTKSGHRISIVDKPGKQSIVLATPQNLKMSLLEKSDETGRPAFLLHAADGDMILSAPNGRIHFHSKYFSREVGTAENEVAAARIAPSKQPVLPELDRNKAGNPKTAPPDTQQYATSEEAAVAAMKASNPASVKAGREYGGWVHKNSNGTYSPDPPTIGGKDGLTNMPDKGADDVVWWHTHGANDPGYNNEDFSGATGDKGYSAANNAVGYLATPTGVIKKYDPTTDTATTLPKVAPP